MTVILRMGYAAQPWRGTPSGHVAVMVLQRDVRGFKETRPKAIYTIMDVEDGGENGVV